MLRSLTFALIAAILTGVHFAEAAQTDLTGTTWLAEDIMGAGVVDRVQSTLQPLPDGRVAGSGGCNRFTGTGNVAGGKVDLGLLAATRMACAPAVMAQEDKFLKALSASKRYEISPQGLMHFFDQAGAVTVRLSRIN